MAFDVMEVDQSVLAVAHNNIPLSEVIYVDASFTMAHPKKGENLNSGRKIATIQESGVRQRVNNGQHTDPSLLGLQNI